MRLTDVAHRVSGLFKSRTRRVAVGSRRAHVEFRNVGDEELERFSAAVRKGIEGIAGVDWIEVNAYTRRVVFAYAEAVGAHLDLVAIVERAERTAQVDSARFDEAWAHPADYELGALRLVEVLADAAACAIGLGLTFSPVPRMPMSGNLVTALSLVRSTPRLRGGLEDRFGRDRADLFLSLANSVTQGLAQRPMSSMVDSLHKLSLLREIQSQRAAFYQFEGELCRPTGDVCVGGGSTPARPVPLPKGPIEEYSDKAWAVSLSGFALSFIATRSVQRATAALFGGLPRPARVGRDVFTGELARVFAARGILTLDSNALRRLDRLDCLVLQSDLVSKDTFVLSAVNPEDPEQVADARLRAEKMFDPEHPLKLVDEGLWKLGPWGNTDATRDTRLQGLASKRLAEGGLLLALERAGRIVAMVEVEIVPRTGVEELIAAAHEAEMRVVVAAQDDAILDRLTADDAISEEEGLRAGIRRLQREGRTVAMVGTGRCEGFALADVAIGLYRTDEPSPWGAHVVCRGDLKDVRTIISACPHARRASKQAVKIAISAASMGALVSAGGLLKLTTRRVLFVVNAASMLSIANAYRVSQQVSRVQLPEPRDPTPWHALEAEGVLTRLGTTRQGLKRTDVVRRKLRPPTKKTAVGELLEVITDELFNPLAPLLAAGAGLSAVVGSIGDASMVAGVVGVNALVGGVQRFKTERKIQELQRSAMVRSRVRRDGLEFVVDAVDLVPGDVVLLGPGDLVPSDCRIIEANSVEVDASSLTGESLPVRKSVRPSYDSHVADRGSMLYAGTALASGRAEAVVVATGDKTEARRGAAVARKSRNQGGVEKRLRSLMNLTGPIALAAGVGVVGGGLLRGRRLDEVVGSGVSLAVASVPEGLPLLATAAQLASSERLSERGALVRNGRSIEALGRVDVICLDKTGTVTEGRIVLRSVSDGDLHEFVANVSRTRRHTLACALRACPAPGVHPEQDPTDEALYRAAGVALIDSAFGYSDWRRVSEISFESGRGYFATLAQSNLPKEVNAAQIDDTSNSKEQQPYWVVSVKGAPEVVLPMCGVWKRGASEVVIDEAVRLQLAAQASRFASQGLRVLAVSERLVDPQLTDAEFDPEVLHEMNFLGFLAFTDPVRPTAKEAISGLRNAGVQTVLVTGDHPSTAQAVAGELGLLAGRKVVVGAQLLDMSDNELDVALEEVAIFARVTPSQKVRIVRAFQRAGRVVAMAGDGANDAPSIRLADVGVAVGQHSTAAARGAADIVLVDGSIETLVAAIAEGRAMWASVKDAVSILIGGNLGEIGFTAAVGFLSSRPPLNARQLLLVNLLTDVAPAMAIALKPPSEEVLADMARHGPDAALGQPLNREIALRAGLTALGAGTAWTIARVTSGRTTARTVALAALVGTQLGQTIRSGGGNRTVTMTGLGSAALLAAVIQTPVLSQAFGCKPLGPISWGTAIGASVAATNVPSLVSWLRRVLREQYGVQDDALVASAVQQLPAAVRGLLELPAEEDAVLH